MVDNLHKVIRRGELVEELDETSSEHFIVCLLTAAVHCSFLGKVGV